jgi:hypothetical protein
MVTRILLVTLFTLAACGPRPQPVRVTPVEPEPVEPEPVEPQPVDPPPEPVEPAPVDDWKACHEPEDCVAVGCGCSCSGCGGFSHEDVVSKDFEEAWYEKKGCEPATVCPQVCCPPMSIVCQDGQCAVVAGEVLNVH